MNRWPFAGASTAAWSWWIPPSTSRSLSATLILIPADGRIAGRGLPPNHCLGTSCLQTGRHGCRAPGPPPPGRSTAAAPLPRRCAGCRALHGAGNNVGELIPRNDFSPTETLFLRISGNAKGVLQVHRAPGFKWRCVCASHRWPTQSVSAVRFLSRMQSRGIASCFELKKSGSWPRGSSSSATGSQNCFCSALETRA